MYIFELFAPDNMMTELKQKLLNILTPLMARKVPFVTIQQIIDELRHAQTGLTIDRSLVVKVLDPSDFIPVQKIEGDRIYLKMPEADKFTVDDNEKEKQKNHMKDTAGKQAEKEIKKK